MVLRVDARVVRSMLLTGASVDDLFTMHSSELKYSDSGLCTDSRTLLSNSDDKCKIFLSICIPLNKFTPALNVIIVNIMHIINADGVYVFFN